MNNSAKRLKLSFVVPFLFVFTLFLIHFLNTELDWQYVSLGIYPRDVKGITGIITHVFVHSSWEHLFTNSIPVLVLMWCIFYSFKDTSYIIIGIMWILTGTITFAIARPSWHIGASGLIYAMAFFLFFCGVLSKKKAMIAISLLVVFLYGSIIWQTLPYFVKADVSWEGHLSGSISGIITSLIFYKKNVFPHEREPVYDEAADEELYRQWTESLTVHVEQDKSKIDIPTTGTTEDTKKAMNC